MSESDLKTALLSSRNRKVKFIEVEVEGEVRKVGVLQVSLAARKKLRQMAHDAKTSEQMMRADVECVIESACDETGKRLFAATDRETLAEQPAGGWVDKIAKEAALLMRGPIAGVCRKPITVDDKPVVDERGEPKVCGCEFIPGEKFCPRCAAPQPTDMEVARGN